METLFTEKHVIHQRQAEDLTSTPQLTQSKRHQTQTLAWHPGIGKHSESRESRQGPITGAAPGESHSLMADSLYF